MSDAAQTNTKKHKRTKRIAVLALAAGLVVAGGAAFAYWTTGGTGTGSAATGNVAGITINQTSTITGLYPGGPAVALAGDFTNGNSGPVHVNQVTVAVDPAFSAKADTTKPACTAADFTVTQPGLTNADIASGTHVGGWSGATVKLLNSATNQDNCKSVTVPFVFTSN
jgi:ABC-type glycerol-3-phosphate transport system substrate-binding protein